MNDGNGDRAEKRYVIVDHDGVQVEQTVPDKAEALLLLWGLTVLLPVGGRFTVTRVA